MMPNTCTKPNNLLWHGDLKRLSVHDGVQPLSTRPHSLLDTPNHLRTSPRFYSEVKRKNLEKKKELGTYCWLVDVHHEIVSVDGDLTKLYERRRWTLRWLDEDVVEDACSR